MSFYRCFCLSLLILVHPRRREVNLSQPLIHPISSERTFLCTLKKILSGVFCSKVKIAACQVFVTPPKLFFLPWNKGQLRAAVTRLCRLSTPLCHTYSEPSGHEDSPGGTQNIPYLFKNLSKLRLSDPFFGLFLMISEVGSQIYIAILAIFKIWVFSATFRHEISLYAIDIDLHDIYSE